MSYNNITPIWVLGNPYKVPYHDGYYYITPDPLAAREGPYDTYEEACEYLIKTGGEVHGKKEWLV